MYATDGLVIDIRGNPGGNNEIGQTIVKQLLKKPTATSQLGCPWPQFNRPWKSHNNRQRKMPPEAGIAIGGVIGVIY